MTGILDPAPTPPDVEKQDPDATEPSNPTDQPKGDDYPDG